MSKRKGWKGESQRHAVAKRGINTKTPEVNPYRGQMMVVSNDGAIYIPSEGIMSWLGDVKNKFAYAKDVIVHDKGYAKEMDYERRKAGVEKREKKLEEHKAKIHGKEKSKSETEINEESDNSQEKPTKQYRPTAKPNDVIDMEPESEDSEEPEQPESNQIVPSKPSVPARKTEHPFLSPQNITKNVSSVLSNLVSRRTKVTDKDIDTITTEILESPDADAIISVAENKEKMVLYSAELKRMIDLLKAEKQIKRKEFSIEENEIYSKIKNDIRLNKTQTYNKIEAVRNSFLPQEEKEHKITALKNALNTKENDMNVVYLGARERNRADLDYVDNLVTNLEKIHRQVDKRFQSSVR